MPRGPRLDAPGILHHIRARGIERRKIFFSDGDRRDFLRRLGTVVVNQAAFVYAWSLMPNHFHMALRTGIQPITRTLSRLLTGYAISFNKRHKRHGHVFQNRYWSTIVEDERYFIQLVRYIHLNPVLAGLVKDMEALSTWPWSGHSALMGNNKNPFQDVNEVLGRFGKTDKQSRVSLVDYMRDEQAKKQAWIFCGGGLHRSLGRKVSYEETTSAQGRKLLRDDRQIYDERILGSGQFVESILNKAEESPYLIQRNKQEHHKVLNQLIVSICKHCDIDVRELRGAGRRPIIVKARHALAYVAIRKLGCTATETGLSLGMSKSSASRGASQGENALKSLSFSLDDLLQEIK